MNDNDLMRDVPERNTYRATTNLNTAIENPQINIDSAVGVNIRDIESNSSPVNNSSFNNSYDSFSASEFNANNMNNNYYNGNISSELNDVYAQSVMNNTVDQNQQTNQFIQNNNVVEDTSSYVSATENESANYVPTMEEKKRHDKKTVQVPREFKMILFIAFILFIFILVIPYIYDFMQDFVLS